MTDMTRFAGGLAAPLDHPRLNVTSPRGCPPSVRLIDSPDTALVVGAAPTAEIGRLLRCPPFRQRPLAYLLIASGDAAQPTQLYIGETLDGEERMAEHRRDPRLPADDVVLIACHAAAFGRDAIQALQHGLTAQAHRAARCRVVGKPPQRSWLQIADPQQIANWLAVLRTMLMAAGCNLLEPPGARLQPRLVAVTGAPQDGLRGRPEPGAIARAVPAAPPDPVLRLEPASPLPQGFTLDLPPDLHTRAGARRYVLAWDGMRAEAVAFGDWTILCAGSQVASDEAGIQPCLSRKRRDLRAAGVLRPSGRRGPLRVAHDVALPSLTNACRVVTGTNRPGALWVET